MSYSSLVSPGPRRPMPPFCCISAVPWPPRRGSKYFNCASSTCSFPSCVRARWAKISKINRVRSITLAGITFSKFFCWAGVISSSKITVWAFSSRTVWAISSIFPPPMRAAALNAFTRTWKVCATSPPAVCARRTSSSKELVSRVSVLRKTPTKITFSIIYIVLFMGVGLACQFATYPK